MKYAIISANRGNIGDDIQTLAAEQFLPNIDLEIDQDEFGLTKPEEETKVICNGWWAKEKSCWPPAPEFIPLIISVHITANTKGRFISPEAKYLNNNLFGARDSYTLDFLRISKVPSYLSYCLTLSFPKYFGERKGIVCSDIYPEAVPHLQKYITDTVSHFRPEVFCKMSPVDRRVYAKKLLKLYMKSEFVITTRLHCALPCLAMGTPVVFIPTDYSLERLRGYENILNIISFDQLRILDPSLIRNFNIDQIKNNLINTCKNFTSFWQENIFNV